MSNHQRSHPGFSLTELMSVITILGLLAGIILPRVMAENDDAKISACHSHRGNIEIQAELWMNNTGSWPATDLSDVGLDLNYFPQGLPTCPVDSSTYAIDPVTGRVIGHNH